jgi:hypothetical protein
MGSEPERLQALLTEGPAPSFLETDGRPALPRSVAAVRVRRSILYIAGSPRSPAVTASARSLHQPHLRCHSPLHCSSPSRTLPLHNPPAS